jgi:Zn-dependent M16 (insulinase) family peptidase
LIDGSVPLPELFDILNNQVDPLILAQQAKKATDTYSPPQDWLRPFVETSTAEPLDIKESQTKVVEFMEEDESMGEVTINWLGAPPTNYRTNSALKLLGNYLTQSATAPLQKEFIEIPKPYTTSIGIYSEDRVNKNELTMGMFDVPTKHLNDIADLVRAKLAKVVKEEGIDMERMAMIIRRDKRKLLNYMETSVSSVLSDAVIGGESRHIFIDRGTDLIVRLPVW